MSEEFAPSESRPAPVDVTVPAPAPNLAREQQQRLMAEGRERCPWCDGTGERRLHRGDLVLCAPCGSTGEADRWTGDAADDWRRRRDADAAWRRDHFLKVEARESEEGENVPVGDAPEGPSAGTTATESETQSDGAPARPGLEDVGVRHDDAAGNRARRR